MQGLAGGLAGGMIGSLLFGGMGHASSGGVAGGGIGFFEIVIVALLLYLTYRFFKKRRMRHETAAGYQLDGAAAYQGGEPPSQEWGQQARSSLHQDDALHEGEVRRGLDHITRYDPAFDGEGFKETAQDLFFRIQAGWTNRSIDGIEAILTPEMADFFNGEFASMKQKGIVNHLENIAIRKVELTEAWQETGKDYITILITANLLDYTVDVATREVVEGSKIVPVKFQEFWTFCREVGAPKWQLSAINQVER
ncbi:MAG: Tim44 domain-containing protein [Syntrophobacteraceae bacterium]